MSQLTVMLTTVQTVVVFEEIYQMAKKKQRFAVACENVDIEETLEQVFPKMNHMDGKTPIYLCCPWEGDSTCVVSNAPITKDKAKEVAEAFFDSEE